MKALKDHAEFISDNVCKFHDLIKNYENNKDNLEKEVQDFTSELYNRAGETIGMGIDILDAPNTKLEAIVALFMQASELWQMFCEEYYKTYPEDPKYFDEAEVLKTFESIYKQGAFNK